ncbi:glycosyltransferase family 9 protein [Gluconacetobacter aggeris]|uniref:Glycosyltransferase family 9 protein n=1 Tax=Gluconacetobacter aggeris TaxID=1286186 RepID=A0A7W4IVA0_9PROT|nr:glycosyltransferase family 9 protein [Gluconacetobacter aggeris]MBB2169642.1 glycosyltransferase family 9 protein [Gluconacetobacter aggeris]
MKTPTGHPILSGVIAFRVLVSSRHKLTRAVVTADGSATEIAIATPIMARTIGSMKIWIVNAWVDTARLSAGRQKLHMNVYTGTRLVGHIRRFVTVMPQETITALVPDGVRYSDSFVPSALDGKMETIDHVLSLPVEWHRPQESLFPGTIRSILILRTDQLGDVSASLPAMARIKALFPEARITVLSQRTIQPILVASGIADEYLSLSLSYNSRTERRFLTTEAEQAVRDCLRGREFDLAMDLSPGAESQTLMRLCAARYRVSFKPDQFPFIDFGIEVTSRDKINRKAIVNHAAHVSMLVSALEGALHMRQTIVARLPSHQDVSVLNAHGVEKKGYIVVHSGARHPINRWPLPSFLEFCALFYSATRIPVLLFIDSDDLTSTVEAQCESLDGIRLVPSTDMETFDTLLSNARLLVANDTGPKHLAATRGVRVVSIAIPRLNWQEWGQNRSGVILSRRVPCAGCGLNDSLSCGMNIACLTSVPISTVLEAALEEISPKDEG